LENHKVPILTSILIELGLNPWSMTFKASNLWMLVLICMVFTKLNVFVVVGYYSFLYNNVCFCGFFLYVLAFVELRYRLKSQLYIKFNKQKNQRAFWNSSDESCRFAFWMESILLGHISITWPVTDHTVKNNHRSHDSKEPIGNAY